MSALAIAGLLFAASLHAVWNLLAKRGRDNQVFLMSAAAAAGVCMAPFAVARLLAGAQVPPMGWLFIVISAVLESLYYLLLGKAYQGGDLSFVYPISRGSSPLFVALFATIFQGERIALIGGVGIAFTVIGIYIVHLKSFARTDLLLPFRSIATNRTSQLALLTGATIAAYSVNDKAGIAIVDPVVYIFFMFAISTLLLAPYALTKKRYALKLEWQLNWKMIVLVGAIIGGGYLLILFILADNKVSYATSVRTISVVFGAVLGAVVLKETLGDKKILGACVIFAGIICIGLAQ